MKRKILIIDNELEACKKLKYALLDAGHYAYYCLTGREGLIHLLKGHYNLAILETGIDDSFGSDMIPIIRREGTTPILVVSSSNRLEDKVTALRSGADDYIVKPVEIEEILARIDALCRRYEGQKKPVPQTSVLFSGRFTVDLNYRTIFHNGLRLDLTRKEFRLLHYFIVNKEQTLSKEQIYQYVWKEEPFNSDNSVMCQVYHLRQKIEKIPTKPKYIQTVWGYGYRFIPD